MQVQRPASPNLRRRGQLGVTLIEALVALMVMGFGMVALIELMTNLRRSGDMGKQRNEAMRIAQAEMAALRNFSVLTKPSPAASDVIDFDTDLVSAASRNTMPSDSNATYSVTRTAGTLNDGDSGSEPQARTVQVAVSWSDRATRQDDAPQTIVLNTIIARVDPAFAGAVGFTPPPGGTRQPGGRHPAIPTTAKDLGDKTSAYRPSSLSGTVWVFNNITGVIVGKCTIEPGTAVSALTPADVESCRNNTVGYLLSGTIRFSNTSPANPSLPEAMAFPLDMAIITATYQTPEIGPSGAPRKDADGNYIMQTLTATAPSYECFDNAPGSTPSTQAFVNYDCIVYPDTGSPRTWSGKLVLAGFDIGTLESEYRVCRYSADYNGNGTPYVSDTVAYDNFEHPEVYVGVTGSLARQNFLVIKGTSTCPTAPAVDPANRIFVDYSTRQLQPSP
jgi:Tfp pilus assembly protein PilV